MQCHFQSILTLIVPFHHGNASKNDEHFAVALPSFVADCLTYRRSHDGRSTCEIARHFAVRGGLGRTPADAPPSQGGAHKRNRFSRGDGREQLHSNTQIGACSARRSKSGDLPRAVCFWLSQSCSQLAARLLLGALNDTEWFLLKCQSVLRRLQLSNLVPRKAGAFPVFAPLSSRIALKSGDLLFGFSSGYITRRAPFCNTGWVAK
jgi:hypothetical protein